jgi:hypothetical protein
MADRPADRPADRHRMADRPPDVMCWSDLGPAGCRGTLPSSREISERRSPAMAGDAPVVIDHPLRGLYRAVAFLLGVAMIAFGVAALVVTSGQGFFADEGTRVVGLTANPALGVVSIVVGALTAVAVLVGRNFDAQFNVYNGYAFLAVGIAGLMFIRTGINVLAFSMSNVIVAFLLGLILLAAGLYGRVSPRRGSASRAFPSADRTDGVVQNTTSQH